MTRAVTSATSPNPAPLTGGKFAKPNESQDEAGETLSPRQLDYLAAIRAHVATHGHPPTLREIGAAVGSSVRAVTETLGRLRRRGVVTWSPGAPRSLRIQTAETPEERINRLEEALRLQLDLWHEVERRVPATATEAMAVIRRELGDGR